MFVFVVALLLLQVDNIQSATIELPDMLVNGDDEGFEIIDDETGYFAKQDDIMPGDKITRSFRIQNNHDESFDLVLYYDNLLSYHYEKNKKVSGDFMEQIEITLTYGGKEVYKGPLQSKQKSIGTTYESGIKLGEIQAYEEAVLQVDYHFVGDLLTNKYQKAEGSFDWILHVTKPIDEPKEPEPSDPNAPVPPVSPKPEPQDTGDITNIEKYLLFLCLSGALVLYVTKKNGEH